MYINGGIAMTENEIWETIRDSIHLTDMQIIKIIVRFAVWHNSFYHTSPLDISYFLKTHIKSADIFEKTCHRVLYFNLYIAGFINFCNFLDIPQPSQQILREHEKKFIDLENDVNEIVSQIETHFKKNNIPVTYQEIFNCIINQN